MQQQPHPAGRGLPATRRRHGGGDGRRSVPRVARQLRRQLRRRVQQHPVGRHRPLRRRRGDGPVRLRRMRQQHHRHADHRVPPAGPGVRRRPEPPRAVRLHRRRPADQRSPASPTGPSNTIAFGHNDWSTSSNSSIWMSSTGSAHGTSLPPNWTLGRAARSRPGCRWTRAAGRRRAGWAAGSPAATPGGIMVTLADGSVRLRPGFDQPVHLQRPRQPGRRRGRGRLLTDTARIDQLRTLYAAWPASRSLRSPGAAARRRRAGRAGADGHVPGEAVAKASVAFIPEKAGHVPRWRRPTPTGRSSLGTYGAADGAPVGPVPRGDLAGRAAAAPAAAPGQGRGRRGDTPDAGQAAHPAEVLLAGQFRAEGRDSRGKG